MAIVGKGVNMASEIYTKETDAEFRILLALPIKYSRRVYSKIETTTILLTFNHQLKEAIKVVKSNSQALRILRFRCIAFVDK